MHYTTPHLIQTRHLTCFTENGNAGRALDKALRGTRGLAVGVGDASVLLGFLVSRWSTSSYSLSTGCS